MIINTLNLLIIFGLFAQIWVALFFISSLKNSGLKFIQLSTKYFPTFKSLVLITLRYIKNTYHTARNVIQIKHINLSRVN